MPNIVLSFVSVNYSTVCASFATGTTTRN